MDKATLAKEAGISEKDAEEILDDLVVAGVLQKFDTDGNPEEVKPTKARKKRAREGLEHALVAYGVAQAMMDGLAMTENGLAIKDKK